jgi:hypothetical protein
LEDRCGWNKQEERDQDCPVVPSDGIAALAAPAGQEPDRHEECCENYQSYVDSPGFWCNIADWCLAGSCLPCLSYYLVRQRDVYM